MVNKVVYQFRHLLTNYEWFIARMGAYGHDLIEDARMTYNDIKQIVGKDVADVIYLCTEERGRDRGERHSERYYMMLSGNEVATFVKLCDIIANVKFSILTNSSMLDKYRKEYYDGVIRHLNNKRFREVFVYLEKLIEL
jgi:(p)ppGpp synthase/HD superfamily hydrolase